MASSTATEFAESTAISERLAPVAGSALATPSVAVHTSAQSATSSAAATSVNGNPLTTPSAESVTALKEVAGVKPVLDEISPTSGPAGEAYPLVATVRGRGFASRGNSVT